MLGVGLSFNFYMVLFIDFYFMVLFVMGEIVFMGFILWGLGAGPETLLYNYSLNPKP